MKKVLNVCLSLILTSQFALASEVNGLKEAVEEFQYAMTVEWDQQDQSFVEEQQHKLQDQITILIQNGLEAKDLKNYFDGISNIKYDNLLVEIDANDITDDIEVQRYIQERLKTSYARGASWNGDLSIGAVFGIILLVVFIGASVAAKKDREMVNAKN